VASPYSRKQRFIQLLRKVLGVDSGPSLYDKVWNVLAASAPFGTTQDIVLCLKHSGLRAKHYTSLHVFAKAFLTKYTSPVGTTSVYDIETKLEKQFHEIEYLWYRNQFSESFFSYAWLLEKLLRLICEFETYKPFLKILVCPHRRAKYETRWKLLTKSLRRDSLLYPSDTPQAPLETVLECCA